MPRAKRTTLPGFPRQLVFECREDVDAYLSGDRITCLLCGHSYKLLEPHLRGAHAMTGNEYREAYGLPFKRGLCSTGYSEIKAEQGRDLYHNNKERQDAALAKAKAIQAEHGNPQRHKPKFWRHERTRYDRETYYEFARRIVAGRAAMHVEQDDDMPTVAHIQWYLNRDRDFAAHWEKEVQPVRQERRLTGYKS